MKRSFLLSLFAFLVVINLSAQRELPAIYESAEEITLRYQLDADQVSKLDQILETRTNNFASIESLRGDQEPIYWMKRKSIYLGEQASIRMILTTEAQVAAHATLRRELRMAESELIQSFLAEGKTKEEARQLLLQNKY